MVEHGKNTIERFKALFDSIDSQCNKGNQNTRKPFVPKSGRRCNKCNRMGFIASECKTKQKFNAVITQARNLPRRSRISNKYIVCNYNIYRYISIHWNLIHYLQWHRHDAVGSNSTTCQWMLRARQLQYWKDAVVLLYEQVKLIMRSWLKIYLHFGRWAIHYSTRCYYFHWYIKYYRNVWSMLYEKAGLRSNHLQRGKVKNPDT